ncbi:MAG: ACT domain-containing protein [Actinomycetota bacterium]|nr:ACT domain-containing protein [Actinomycetota bacterium]
MSYLLRIVLPDRPGALGAVATALGAVGADILSLDVIERSPGSATDDLVVELPPDRLADSLVSAAATVAGVHVESIRPYAGQIDPYRELELLDSLAAGSAEPLGVLANGVTKIFRAGWALVLGSPAGGIAEVVGRGGAAPEVGTLPIPWWPAAPARTLSVSQPDDEPAGARGWAPPDWDRVGTELAVAPLGAGALLVGRPALRWLPSELVRLQHFAAIAATVTAQ